MHKTDLIELFFVESFIYRLIKDSEFGLFL